MAIVSTLPVIKAWSSVGVAYSALIAAIRKKPQPNTVILWQKFALACQVLSNAMWAEERARQPAQTPPETVPPPHEEPFDPRITTWVDSQGNERFDFPMCPFKINNPKGIKSRKRIKR